MVSSRCDLYNKSSQYNDTVKQKCKLLFQFALTWKRLTCINQRLLNSTSFATKLDTNGLFWWNKLARSNQKLGKEPPARLTLCSLCIMSICNFSYFRFGFEGGIWFLFAPVPVHCLLVAFWKAMIA